MVDFVRQTSSERDLQPVAIVSVDPVTRVASGITRTRQTVQINCAYATGDTITIPAVGEQWYVERFDLEWRLYGRIPFNDSTLNIEPEEGQVSVGSASGPLELNGTEVRSNGTVFRMNGVYYRDDGETLQRSVDKIVWEPITGVGSTETIREAGVYHLIGNALTEFPGAEDVVEYLDNLSEEEVEILENIAEWAANLGTSLFSLVCDNPFFAGLRQLGTGIEPLEQIVSGFQSFINTLWSDLFCGFAGDLDPQTALTGIEGLTGFFSDNPFIQGLAALLGENAIGNLLFDAVNGATEFLQQIVDFLFCDFTGDLTPENILAAIGGALNPLINNPFIQGLATLADTLGTSVGNLFSDSVNGALGLLDGIFRAVFCDFTGDLTPQDIISHINNLLDPIRNNPFVLGLAALADTLGVGVGNLINDSITGATGLLEAVFQTIFCDFTGDFTPQSILAKLGEVLTGIIENPFVAGLISFAEGLGHTAGGGIEKAFAGANELLETIFNIFFCDNEGVPTPQMLVDSISGIMDFIRTNPLIIGLVDFITDLGTTSTGFLQKALEGAFAFFNQIVNALFCNLPGTPTPTEIMASLTAIIASFTDNPYVAMLRSLATALGDTSTNMFQQVLAGLTGIFDWVIDLLGTIFPFINWTVLKTEDFFDSMVSVINQLNPLAFLTGGKLDFDWLPEIGFDFLTGASAWLQDNAFGPLQNAILGGLDGTLTGGLAALNQFFDGALGAGGSLLQQIANAMTGVGTFTGPLGTIRSLFSGITLGGGSLISQITGTLDEFVTDLDIVAIVSKITGIDIEDLTSPLDSLGDFFAGFSAFTGTNTLISQVLAQAGSNLTPLISALTGIPEGSITDPVATALAYFGNLRSFFGIDFGAGYSLPSAISGLVTLINQAAAGALDGSLLNSIGMGQVGDLIKFLTGKATGGTAEDVETLFSNLRTMFGGTAALLPSGAFDPIAVANAFIINILSKATSAVGTFKIPATTIANLGINQVTNLVGYITGTGNTAADVQTFFANLRTFLGFNPLGGFTNLTTAVNSFFTALNTVSPTTKLNPANLLGNLGIDKITGLVSTLTGGSTITDLTNFFTNLRTMFNVGTGAGQLNLLTVQTADTLRTALYNIVAGINNTVNAFITQTGLSTWLGATSLTEVANFFTNLRSTFGGANFLSSSFNPVDAVASLVGLIFDPTKIPFLNPQGLLDVSLLTGLRDWSQENVIVPIVAQFLTGLRIDPARFGINSIEDMANVNLGTLGDIAGTLLTSFTEIPANLLSGLLPPGLLGRIPVSNISSATENLLTQGSFGDSSTVGESDGWSWDGFTNSPGGIGGSAKVVVTSSKDRWLYSRQAIPVASGDRVVLTAKIKTSGLVGVNPVTISLVPFIGSASQTPVVIGTSGASTEWKDIGQADDTHYEIWNPDWTSVIVRLGVTSAATAGTVWWDEISLIKTGGLLQNNVTNLIDAWQGIWDGAFPTAGGVVDWTFVESAIAQLLNIGNQGVSDAGAAAGAAVLAQDAADTADGKADAAQLDADAAAAEAAAVGTVANAANASAGTANTNLQTTWNELVNAFDGTTTATGKTPSSVRQRGSVVRTSAITGENQSATALVNAATADGKAVVAQSAAATADTKAVTAQNAASTADGKAVAAQGAASTADGKAVAAQNTASTANTAAGTANTNLQTTWNELVNAFDGTTTATGRTATNVRQRGAVVRTSAVTGENQSATALVNAATADGKAGLAQDAAATADAKAVTADGKAATADAKAVAAQNAASTADGKAVTADGKAVAAQGAASTADGKAVAAQNTASTANTAAGTANTNLQTTWNELVNAFDGTTTATGRTATNVRQRGAVVRTSAVTGENQSATALVNAATAAGAAVLAQDAADAADLNAAAALADAAAAETAAIAAQGAASTADGKAVAINQAIYGQATPGSTIAQSKVFNLTTELGQKLTSSSGLNASRLSSGTLPVARVTDYSLPQTKVASLNSNLSTISTAATNAANAASTADGKAVAAQNAASTADGKAVAINQAIYGQATPGSTIAQSKVFNLTTELGQKLTSSSGLNASNLTAGTLPVARVLNGSLPKAKVTSLESDLSGINADITEAESIAGTAQLAADTAQNAADTADGKAVSINQALYGQPTPGSAIAEQQIPALPQSKIDGLPADTPVAGTLLEQGKAIIELQADKDAAGNQGKTISVDFSSYADGALPATWAVTYSGLPATWGTAYSGPGTSTVRVAGDSAGWTNGNNTSMSAKLIYVGEPGVDDEKTLTDFQRIRGTIASLPGFGTSTVEGPRFWALGRVSDDGNTYVWARARFTNDSFYSMRGEIGCTVNGVEQTPWLTNIDLSFGLSMTLVCGDEGNPRLHEVYSGSNLVASYNEDDGAVKSRLCNLNHTDSDDHTSSCVPYRRWGSITEIKYYNNMLNSAGRIGNVVVSDNFTPTKAGSVARMARTSTTAVSFPAGTTALPNAFFVNEFESLDIDGNDTDGTFTVSKSKMYLVSARIRLNSWINALTSVDLQVKPAGSSVFTTVQRGHAKWGDDAGHFPGHPNGGFVGVSMNGTWLQYLDAGDSVRLVVYRAGGSGNNISATGDGAETYFTISGLQ